MAGQGLRRGPLFEGRAILGVEQPPLLCNECERVQGQSSCPSPDDRVRKDETALYLPLLPRRPPSPLQSCFARRSITGHTGD